MDSEILENGQVKRILEKMRSRCAVREYCSSDVAEKVSEQLRSEDLPWPDDEIVEAVLSCLKSESFLSDERYAVAFARDKAYLTGWGTNKIRMALFAKHLDEATVNEALAKVDATAVQNQLERLLIKKLHSLRSSRSGATASEMEIRAKLIRFGLGRGYPYDSVYSAADEVLKKS